MVESEILYIMGHRVNLEKIGNRALRRAIRGRVIEKGFLFWDDHKETRKHYDHADAHTDSYSHTEYDNHSEHSDYRSHMDDMV